jgi:sugar phosphate isomerase/epimerase
VEGASGDLAARGRRLDAVREILRALETATAAGQQHLMMKVLGLLRGEAPAPDHWMDDQQWSKIAAALEALAREADRRAPDAAAFRRQATLVTDALTLS